MINAEVFERKISIRSFKNKLMRKEISVFSALSLKLFEFSFRSRHCLVNDDFRFYLLDISDYTLTVCQCRVQNSLSRIFKLLFSIRIKD